MSEQFLNWNVNKVFKYSFLSNTGTSVSTFTSDVDNSKIQQIDASIELELDDILFSDDEIKNIEFYDELALKFAPCPFCMKIMKKVVQKVPKGSSIEIIQKGLKKSCSVVPNNKLRTKCRTIMQNSGDKIAEAIVNGVPAVGVCKLILLC